MQDRGINHDKIHFIWNSTVVDMLGDVKNGGLKSLVLENTQTHEKTEISADGCFLAIGHKPNSDLFVGQLKMNDVGYIHTEPDSTKTNILGVFASGDIQDHVYRQAVTAAGSGCMAAIEAEKYLETLHS